MSLRRISLGFVSLTIIGLFYVHQQTKIIELGYQVKEKEEILTQLLDQHKILVYNINVLSSPLNLDKKILSKRLDLSIVTNYRTVRVASASNSASILGRRSAIVNFFFDLFVPKAQAEASTIKK